MRSTYVSANGVLVSDETVDTVIYSLPRLGSGISRDVYALSDTEVLKVSNSHHGYAGGNDTEVAAWHTVAEEDRRYFAAVLAHSPSFRWIVAERLAYTQCDLKYEGIYSTLPNGSYIDHDSLEEMLAVAETYGIGDLHDRNYGVRFDGTYAMLDYACNEERDRCDCGSHGCADCHPGGCECGDWRNCVHEATLCSHRGTYCMGTAVTYRRASLFGFARTTRDKKRVCRACQKPATDQQEQVQQVPGQRSMFRGGWAAWDRMVPRTAALPQSAALPNASVRGWVRIY